MSANPGPWSARLDALQGQLRRAGLDAALIGPSANLRYFLGVDWPVTQRLVLLVVPAGGKPCLVTPAFSLSRAAHVPDTVLRAGWQDGDDAVRLALDALPSGGSLALAAAPDLHADVLIALSDRVTVSRWADASGLIAPVRLRKSDTERAVLAEAARRADTALRLLLAGRVIGQTERELAERLGALLAAQEMPADSIHVRVAAGSNSADLYHESGDTRIRPNSAVLIDLSGAYQGYQADVTRTIATGTPGATLARAYQAVARASEAAFADVRPGAAASHIDRVTREVIERAGFGRYFIHRAGHGIGLELHEGPSLDSANDSLLAPGMAFSIQPGVYLPGEFGVRVEGVGLVTDTGSQRLNEPQPELPVITGVTGGRQRSPARREPGHAQPRRRRRRRRREEGLMASDDEEPGSVDLVDVLSGTGAGTAVAGLRAARGAVRRSAQQAADAIFRPADARGLTEGERLTLGGFVSALTGVSGAPEYYYDWALRAGAEPRVITLVRGLGEEAARPGPYGVPIEPQLRHESEPGPDLSLPPDAAEALGPRLSAALGYVHTVVLHPRDGRSERVQALLDGGFSAAEASIITQLVCMVSFQLRVVHGLRVLAGEENA
jgi:Xaa-Pro dipeptidase